MERLLSVPKYEKRPVESDRLIGDDAERGDDDDSEMVE